MKKLTLFIMLIQGINIIAQVGVGTDNPQGIFNVDSKGNNVATGTPSQTEVTDDFTVNSEGNVGVGTTNPLSKLDVKGNVRVSSLTQTLPASKIPKLVVSDNNGELSLFDGESIFISVPDDNYISNFLMTPDETRKTVYEGKCYNTTDQSSACSIEIVHYSTCSGFTNPYSTIIIVYPEINTGNGRFTGNRKYLFDNKALGGTSISSVQKVSNTEYKYAGTGTYVGTCHAFLSLIDDNNGNIKIESIKRYMFGHFVYIKSISRW